MEPTPRPTWPRRLLRLTWLLVKVGVALGVVGTLAVALLFHKVARDLGDVRSLRSSYRPAQVTRILGRNGTLLAELFVERRTVVKIADIPPRMRLAMLAAEDAGFYEHEGLNYLGMLRAFIVNVRAGRTRQGGSTITQQVVKNILLDPERTYERKLKEVVLARRLEQELSKDEILELYLNHIYFGGGRYGIEEAARYYFGKSVRDVTDAEAALLAGLPAGPEHLSPRHDMRRALARRAFVIGQMEQKGFLDAARAERARGEPVRLAPVVEAQSQLAPEVVEIVRRTLRERAGDGYTRGGYTVHTTIDARLQAAARKAVRENLQALDRRTRAQGPFKPPPPTKKGHRVKPEDKPFEGTPKPSELHRTLVGVVTGTHDDTGVIDVGVGEVEGALKLSELARYNPKNLPASAFAEIGAHVRVTLLGPLPEGERRGRVPLRLEAGAEGALVALDPKTRDVLALIGSYEAAQGALDRATQAKRQPGSTFKAVVYGYALSQRRITPASLFDAAPGGGRHADDAPLTQPMRLRDAVAKSVNPVAQRVLLDAGPQPIVRFAEQLGVRSKLGADLSLALGSYEVAPMEMADVYATYAAGGVHVAPRLVTRIVGPDGAEVKLEERAAPAQVLDEASAYLMTDLLRSVVERGTATKARELGRPAAGKTGTTNQAKDAWFVGYTPSIVCAVWTGYDEPRPLGGGKEAGATAALPAWVSFMKVAHEGAPVVDFVRPSGLVVVKIDPATGKRAWEGQEGAIDEVFLAGTEPAETAEPDAGAPDAGGESDAGHEAGAGAPEAPAPPSSAAREASLPGLPP